MSGPTVGRPTAAQLLSGQRVLVCDGAMGTMLHAAGAALDRSLPELNLSDPGLVATIHDSYLSAGADIIQANTFGANGLWLADHGFPDKVAEINRAGVRLARAAARWRRNTQASNLELTVRLMAMLLLCLPTLHAWYLAALVPLLPFTRSWGLVLWTAMAPIYWLHAVANVQASDIIEVPWVTALAHLPALAVLAYEAMGRSEAESLPATASVVPEPV